MERFKGKSIREIVAEANGHFDGLTAFYLHDTMGFHVDVLTFLAGRKGWTVDREGYNELMEQQREKSRSK
jgi:alanyl-tRNA synthetase